MNPPVMAHYETKDYNQQEAGIAMTFASCVFFRVVYPTNALQLKETGGCVICGPRIIYIYKHRNPTLAPTIKVGENIGPVLAFCR